ncbi:hypothetical protein M433DRAFT_8977 [Acidomyces richmondensis BFW]|nr:hypothetical protein M433DRAFT_8977 [Acidomyces richmondensis BFW]
MLLSVKNLKLRQPSKKLLEKYIGPFVVVEAVGAQAYRIRLLPKYRLVLGGQAITPRNLTLLKTVPKYSR